MQPKKWFLCIAKVQLAVQLLYVANQLVETKALTVKTNKMRYATTEASPSLVSFKFSAVTSTKRPEPSESNIQSSESRHKAGIREQQSFTKTAPLAITRKEFYDDHDNIDQAGNDEEEEDMAKLTEEKQKLDAEDLELLEKFYKSTKESDPFSSDSPSVDQVWRELEAVELNRYNALTDLEGPTTRRPPDRLEWSLEPKLPAIAGDLTSAKYSPELELLTSYDPIRIGRDNTNRVVGATLHGQGPSIQRLSVSSKSASDAIKLHNELLAEPARDGKVRVRMYYHRAIHDEPKLYGNGPWKYWGHGWGLEFGFDPQRKNPEESYQRGYTIERAFGRDFCRDQKNCRQPDPEFFKTAHDAGKYSKQQFRAQPKSFENGDGPNTIV